MLEVCCALIFDGEKLLAVQRGADSDHPSQWEFPGGKIEKGESAVACIRRELQEELSVSVEVEAYLLPQVYDYGFKKIRLHPFICRLNNDAFKLNEHVGLRWVEASNFIQLDWQAADFELIRKNEARILQRFRKNDDD